MPIENFNDMISHIRSNENKKIAVSMADDEEVLAVFDSCRYQCRCDLSRTLFIHDIESTSMP